MSQTLATLTSELRVMAHDTTTSNVIFGETPEGTNDGTNTNFRLQNQNIVTSSVYTTLGALYRQQTGFTMDYANGIITFSVAPTAGINPFQIDYAFQWFPDADYTVFLNNATRDLGPGDVNDPTGVPEGLISALYQYALFHFWMRRSTSYAHKFSSGGGPATQQVDVVTKAFKTLADAAYKSAADMRKQYYDRQGQKQSPSSGTTGYGIDPYSPRR
jgi:hypothetical protein